MIRTVLPMLAVCAAFAQSAPFSRYQTIIDRKPFGPEPVDFDPEADPATATSSAGGGAEAASDQRSVEEQQLASSVRVSILNVTPSGAVAVGFTDTAVKPPENYYLLVGRSQNGWTVKSADPGTEQVVLEKGGVEVSVKLGEASSGGGQAAGVRNVRNQQPAASFVPPAPGSGPGFGGGLARLRQRRLQAQQEERENAERKREADAAAKAEQAERQAREEEEKARAAAERAEQREALMQIQEQLKRAREERAAEKMEKQEESGEANDSE